MKVHPSPAPRALPAGISDILAVAFSTTVAMWAVGYVGYMPLTNVRPAIFLTLMLACLIVGGWVAGRYSRRGALGGAWIGLMTAALNLLVLGSLIMHPPQGQAVPHAWLWLPGVFVVSPLLAAVGAMAGRQCIRHTPSAGTEYTGVRHTECADYIAEPNWIAGIAWAACAAALLLITVGGLVTGFRAGMAVPNWPGSFEYNMFLYPLALMTGGVFYEHAHRLLGTLLGAGTLILAIYLTLTLRQRKGLVALIWAVGICVLIQGILGGYRVTEDSYALAVIHGAFAHAVLAGLVVIAVMLSRAWLPVGWTSSPSPDSDGLEVHPTTSDRILVVVLVASTLVQTLLGVLVRQLNVLLLTHITVATLVALVAVGAGMRAWGANPRAASLRRCGSALMIVLVIQLVLGITAVAFRTPSIDASPKLETLADLDTKLPVAPVPALITTAHQANAAVMLWVSAMLAAWTWRPVVPESSAQEVGKSRLG